MIDDIKPWLLKRQNLILLIVCLVHDITNYANMIKHFNVTKKMIKERKSEYKAGYFININTLD